jgi:hypothetical protein
MPTYVHNNMIPAVDDPGTGNAIPVDDSCKVEFTIANAVETNTCAIPEYIGQLLILCVYSLAGSGTRAITFASAINKAGNTIATFADAGDSMILRGAKKAGALCWRVQTNDGVTLS